MKGHHAGQPGNRVQQSGNIGIADEHLGVAGHGGVVHPFQETDRAIAAANAPDGIDGGVLKGMIEVREPLVVGAGQVAVASVGALAENRLVTQRTAERLRSC